MYATQHRQLAQIGDNQVNDYIAQMKLQVQALVLRNDQ